MLPKDPLLILFGLIWLFIFSAGLCVASLEPGYLDFDNLPDTNFSCVGKVIGGYYADLEANCQMFHVCTIGQLDEPMDIRFLCLNGTVFDQETRVCERIDEVDCSKSEKFYSLNLELYGNTQPPILEDDGDTESPPIEKSTIPSTTSTTTTTTTTTPRPKTTTTTRPPQFFSSTIRTAVPSSYHKLPPSHHFPAGNQHNSPHYTPQEINISLNPGAPPDIRTKPSQFPVRSHTDSVNSDNKKVVVTTDSSVYESASENANGKQLANRLHLSSTTERNSVNYNNHQTPEPQNNFNFNFNYHDIDTHDFSSPRPHNYHYQNNIASFRPPGLSGHSYSDSPFRSSTHRNEYLPVTRKNFEANHPTPTARSFFLQPIKSPSHQYFTRTEKPQDDDLPVPVLPTLSPIVFSSPAPFTLNRHIETKRFTDGHESPPRIIISASASVSDASGRTLNYSLGTIGAAQILAQPPSSYDDYKEDDVVLDPFYHDVPKVQNKPKRPKRETTSTRIASRKSGRTKRSPQSINPSDIIKSEDEAIEVLKFLFDWYKNHEKTTKPSISIPVSPEEITSINKEFSRGTYNTEDISEDTTLERARPSHEPELKNSDLFNSNSKFNILGDVFGTSISRDTVIQDPVTQSYRVSSNENLLSDIAGRSSSIVTKTPVIIEHYNNKHTENEYHANTKTVPSSNKQKPYRGRHRFTAPYSSTERQEITDYDEELYKTKSSSHSKQHVYNGGVIHGIRNSYTPTPSRRYQNSYEPNKSWDRRNAASETTHLPNPNTVSSSTKTFGESIPAIATNQEEPKREKNEKNKSVVAVNHIQSFAEKEFTKNYKDHVSTAHPQHEETLTESFNTLFTEAPIYWDTPGDVLNIHNNSNNNSNMPLKPENNTNVNSSWGFSQDKSNEFYDQDFNLEELNKAESQKTTKQLQQTSTENYGPFDVYDYVNDNYEPETYVENPEELVEQQLEKGKKEFEKGIVHEETHINVDFTEHSHDTSSEGHTASTSEKESELHNLSVDKSEELSKTYGQTTTNKYIKSDEGDGNTATFKYIDKNLNSFSDILKSLRDFQRYEQNIYDYNHNLLGIKEYDQRKDKADGEIRTTTSPTTLQSITNEFEFFYGMNNETGDQHDRFKFNSSVSFKNFHRENYKIDNNEEEYTDSTKFVSSVTQSEKEYLFTTQSPEEGQLYTSKPFRSTNSLKFHTLLDLDHSESTQTLSLAETTISNIDKETVPPIESTTIKNEIYESATDEITTLKIETEQYSTGQTNSRPKSKAKSRSRHRSRENSKRRTHNQPFADYTLGNFESYTERRRKNRRRQQNKPHIPEHIPTTTSEAPFTTMSKNFAFSIEEIQLSSTETLNLPLDENEKSEEELSSTVTASIIEDTTLQTQTNLPNSILNFIVDKNASNGFFITRRPNYTSENENTVRITQSENLYSPITTEKATEGYAYDIKVEHETLQTDTVTMLNDASSVTPTVDEFVITRIENDQLTGHTEKSTSEYPSTIDVISTTSLTENDTPNTTSNPLEILSDDNDTTTFITSVPTSSPDTTLTTTSRDLLETLSTDADTTTDCSTQVNHEINENSPTAVNFPLSSEYDSEKSLIKEIEAATNSTVVSEVALEISEENDISTTTTEKSSSRNDMEIHAENSVENEDTTNGYFTTESVSTNNMKPNAISSKADYKTTTDMYQDYSTLLVTTTEFIEDITKSTLDGTTILPSTKIEIITQINTDTTTSALDESALTIKSKHSHNIEVSVNDEVEGTGNNVEKYNNRRKTQQRLSKKKSPGYRRFPSRHRFSSDSISNTVNSRKSFPKSHRFGGVQAQVTPRPADTTEVNELLIQKLSEEKTPMTDDPLPKNVKPTRGDSSLKIDLSTTPLSTLYKVQLRKERVNKQFIFNCFGKTLNTFYSDPRDCRLFHYCTKGYTKNQLLDMKFVCDFGTHFDDEKLVCTTEIPKRCL
ncbi:hypothetical protein WA026_007084 [Henosepilachna vigintioctopunctata]|uniref:Chitin-binding type-2 domain-containing protein n=1 Tax=Henosepilachna vigintioctopunctata TaxID=420089 RepID=A0AAW1V9F8_9CUCU